ncbi:helix-turn-helix domain-containing protein [Herbaspirillum frisingense]|uniref:helix-turn-helix domain-containing protein n=1 Tax=Herbaspirillum frisingense TaxID=92645 RepID=UPI001F44EC84|nr:helix-turn-helix transcriptional regulator [Herbaspirillum frisingense]UIN20301.1 helix-turn-helix transcriptional regulator [Herbaspirillum frisingense]
MSDFKSRLKEERKRLGLNQEKFAQLGGVSKDTQLNYESGLRAPDSDYLAAVARAGVDIRYLFSGVSAEDQLTNREKELLTIARQLSDEGFASVMALATSLVPNRHRFSINLTDEEQARVEAMARESGISIGEMLRWLAINQAEEILKKPSSGKKK